MYYKEIYINNQIQEFQIENQKFIEKAINDGNTYASDKKYSAQEQFLR